MGVTACDAAVPSPYDEGTFNICSFCYVECLARAGELTKARFLSGKLPG